MFSPVDLMKLIIGFTCVGVFVATSVITVLALGGILKLPRSQSSKLFNVLIVQVVVISVGIFAGLFDLNAVKAKEEVEQTQKQLEDATQTIKAIDTSKTLGSTETKITPRVYIQIADEGQRLLAKKAQAALRADGNLVPGIQNVGAKSPNDTELRYFAAEDAPGANAIASNLSENGITVAPKLVDGIDTSGIRPQHYELWFAKIR